MFSHISLLRLDPQLVPISPQLVQARISDATMYGTKSSNDIYLQPRYVNKILLCLRYIPTIS